MTILVGTIHAGQSLSDPIDCTAGAITRIYMPDDWDGGMLTFQFSPDNSKYYDVFRSNNMEVAINITPGTMVNLRSDPTSPDDIPVSKDTWLKLRSGTKSGPRVQSEDRVFGIEIE